MGRIQLVFFAVLLCGAGAQAQSYSLFTDPKAGQIGDVLTVLIQETATATNRTSTSTDKSNNVAIGSAIPAAGNLLDFIPLHAADSDMSNSYSGNGTTSRSNSLVARISVKVVGLKPNGDLIIEGVRTIKVNGETEAIYLSGEVNPAVIGINNAVMSSNIANLRVEYTGKGTITQGSRPGLIVRFINWVF